MREGEQQKPVGRTRLIVLALFAIAVLVGAGAATSVRNLDNHGRVKAFNDALTVDLTECNAGRCDAADTDAVKPMLYQRWPKLRTAFDRDDLTTARASLNHELLEKQVSIDGVRGGIYLESDTSIWSALLNNLSLQNLIRVLVAATLSVGWYLLGERAEHTRPAHDRREAGSEPRPPKPWLRRQLGAAKKLAGIGFRWTSFAVGLSVAALLVLLALTQLEHEHDIQARLDQNYKRLGQARRSCRFERMKKDQYSADQGELRRCEQARAVTEQELAVARARLSDTETTRSNLDKTKSELAAQIDIAKDGTTKEVLSGMQKNLDALSEHLLKLLARRSDLAPVIDSLVAMPGRGAEAVLSDPRYAASFKGLPASVAAQLLAEPRLAACFQRPPGAVAEAPTAAPAVKKRGPARKKKTLRK